MTGARMVAAMAAYTVLCGLLGWLILSRHRSPSGLALAAAPLLGSAALALELWLYGAVHVPWSGPVLAIPWAALVAIRRRRLLAEAARDLRRAGVHAIALAGDPAAAIMLIVAAVAVVIHLVHLATDPLGAWDAMAMWMYKARLYYLVGSVDLSAVASQPLRHLDYPPLFNLQVDTVYAIAGRTYDLLGRAAVAVGVVTAIAVTYVVVHPRAGRRLAAAAALALAVSPIAGIQIDGSGASGYADYPLAALLLVAAAFVVAGPSDEADALAIAFAALAGLTKNEGLPFLLVVVIVVAARRWRGRLRPRPAPVWLLPASALLAVICWHVFAALHGYRSDLASRLDVLFHPDALTSRAGQVAAYGYQFALANRDYGLLLLAVASVAVLTGLCRRNVARWVALLLATQLMSYLIAYLVTPYDLTWHLSTSFDRLLVQIAPLSILAIGLYSGRETPRHVPASGPR